MVREYCNLLDQLLHQDPTLRLGGLLPHAIDVQVPERCCNRLEPHRYVISGCPLLTIVRRFGSNCLDLASQPALLLGEELSADLLLVVELE